MTPERVRRERTVAVLLALAAGLLGLLAASRTWATADVTDVLAGRLRLRLSGRHLAPVVPAVSVVLLAAGAAVLLARRLGRAVAGLVLVLAGAAGAAAAVSAARTPGTAVAAEVARATGRTAGPQVAVTTTAWPWLAVVSGVLAVLSGVVVVVGGRRWSAPSDRFESPGAGGTLPVAEDAERRPEAAAGAGEGASTSDAAHDASVDTSSGAASAGDASSRGSSTDSERGAAEPEPADPEPADAWDALTRGEDPTR